MHGRASLLRCPSDLLYPLVITRVPENPMGRSPWLRAGGCCGPALAEPKLNQSSAAGTFMWRGKHGMVSTVACDVISGCPIFMPLDGEEF
jgi:hypothetical protein